MFCLIAAHASSPTCGYLKAVTLILSAVNALHALCAALRQNLLAFGDVSTYPVAMAMPRMTKGRSMPNMPTIAIGS